MKNPRFRRMEGPCQVDLTNETHYTTLRIDGHGTGRLYVFEQGYDPFDTNHVGLQFAYYASCPVSK